MRGEPGTKTSVRFPPIADTARMLQLQRMRTALLSLLVMSIASCDRQQSITSLCDIARAPDDYIGRAATVRDTIIVDGHGAPLLIPDSSCDKLPYFAFVDGPRPEQFRELLPQLNNRTVSERRAGLAGTYTVEVIRQRYPALIELRLIDASEMRLVAAHSKTRAMDKQMAAGPRERG